MPQEEIECVERWRLDRMFNEYSEVVTALQHTADEEWQAGLLAIGCAETDKEVRVKETELINAILESPFPERVISFFGDERAPCPLCRETPQQDMRGFALPAGLDRHLRGHGARGCVVLNAVVRLARMQINESNGKRFYMPLVGL